MEGPSKEQLARADKHEAAVLYKFEQEIPNDIVYPSNLMDVKKNLS